MNSHFSELESTWKQSKKNLQSSPIDLDSIYQKIYSYKKENFQFYYGTIIILSFTLIGISCFFYFVAPVQELLSRIGAVLMIGGLFVRIIIEVISSVKSKKIHIADNSLNTVNNSIKFYKLRKSIHQIVAPTIVTLYTIGFYMLTPEFLIYMDTWNVILFDVSYFFIAIFLFIQIRKGIRKEMKTVQNIIDLKNELLEEH